VEDDGELEVHSLKKAHIIYTSVNIFSTVEGLNPHQLLMGMDGDVSVILNLASGLWRRVAQLPNPMR
jgi:dihydrodipicolinate synthase/N-acetylneuraminate lyase